MFGEAGPGAKHGWSQRLLARSTWQIGFSDVERRGASVIRRCDVMGGLQPRAQAVEPALHHTVNRLFTAIDQFKTVRDEGEAGGISVPRISDRGFHFAQGKRGDLCMAQTATGLCDASRRDLDNAFIQHGKLVACPESMSHAPVPTSAGQWLLS